MKFMGVSMTLLLAGLYGMKKSKLQTVSFMSAGFAVDESRLSPPPVNTSSEVLTAVILFDILIGCIVTGLVYCPAHFLCDTIRCKEQHYRFKFDSSCLETAVGKIGAIPARPQVHGLGYFSRCTPTPDGRGSCSF
jgi:hypothetical protein